jgi:hypothetical protein
MKFTTIAALFVALYCSSSFAQTEVTSPLEVPSSFIGVWTVKWQGKVPLEARLVLTASGGTWKTLTHSLSNSCVGLQVPVSVESVSPKQIFLRLNFSVLQGCKDDKVVLTRVDEKTVEGKRGSVTLTLSRE